MALFRRSISGAGLVVDIALYEPLMFILGDAVLNFSSTGFITQRHGNSSGAASPRGIYEAADGGWLAIAASNQTIAMRLFEAMGRPDLKTDPRFATNTARMANNAELQETVIGWIKQRPRDEVLAILDKFDVVAAAVNDASDIAADPHFPERTLRPLTGTVFGDVLIPARCCSLTVTTARATTECRRSGNTPRPCSVTSSACPRASSPTCPRAA
jgi:crotonobetainyl-CoA:carnitine CoA-transferase CaiB-like acyl-CoA transferase